MEFKLNQNPSTGAGTPGANGFVSDEEGSFTISASPVVEEVEPNEATAEQGELPRSYGTQSVWLMPRDPHSIFAYWDVDWHLALGEKLPTNRKAQLRLFSADGSQLTEREVEPMAASCYLDVAMPTSHTQPNSDTTARWHMEFCRNEPELRPTPPDVSGGNGFAEFADGALPSQLPAHGRFAPGLQAGERVAHGDAERPAAARIRARGRLQ
jgi:hypothetical protein